MLAIISRYWRSRCSFSQEFLRKKLATPFIIYLVALTGVLEAHPRTTSGSLPYFIPQALVIVEKTAGVKITSSSEISIVSDLGRIALAFVESNKLENLKRMGLNYQVLDYSLPFDEYWLVKAKVADLNKIKHYGRILAHYGSTAIVKGNRNRIWQLSSLGFELKHLSQKPISFSSLMIIPRTEIPQDTFIQRVLGYVSSDTIRSFVQRLQDFGTRYSPTVGCSAAAEYIYQKFDQYGLLPQFDPYFIPSDVYDVRFIYPKAWLVDDKGSALRSPNCGDTWILCHSGNISLLAIDFTDTLNGWLSGGNGNVLTTRNGGLTWDTLSHYVADYLFRIDFLDTALGWAGGGIGDSAVLLKTTDRGRTWIRKPVFAGSIYGIYGYDSQRCWAAGLDINYNGLVLKTTDGGNNWDIQFTLPDYLLGGICFTDSLKGWVVGGNLYTGACAIYHTTNGGDSWIRQTSPGYFLFDVCFLDSLTGFACGYATITKTTNGGATWIRRSVEPMLYSIDFADTTYGIAVGSGGTALVTTNGGSSWRTTYTHDNYIWRNVVGTKVGITHPNEIYIICGHFDATSENPYISAPGADDNASGTASVLEAARILNPYPFGATIKFIGFSGEEQGLFGSQAYAESAYVHGIDIRGVINLDMIGYLDDTLFDLEIYCNDNSEPLATLFVQSCSTYTSVIPYKINDPSATYSDHASFWQFGYPAVLGIERPGTQWNPYYHTTADTLGAGLNSIPFATEVIKGAIASVAILARPYGIGIEEAPRLALSPCREQTSTLLILPNPMKGWGLLKWQLNTQSPVMIDLYSSNGSLVRTLFNSLGEKLNPGFYQLLWDGKDENGNSLPSGIYFIQLKTQDAWAVKKVLLVKEAK